MHFHFIFISNGHLSLSAYDNIHICVFWITEIQGLPECNIQQIRYQKEILNDYNRCSKRRRNWKDRSDDQVAIVFHHHLKYWLLILDNREIFSHYTNWDDCISTIRFQKVQLYVVLCWWLCAFYFLSRWLLNFKKLVSASSASNLGL